MALNRSDIGRPDIVGNHRRAVGVFPTRRAAEQALHALKDSGFPMDRVSVVAKDVGRDEDIAGAEVHDRKQVGNKADDGAKAGAVSGGALGGLTGLLVGLGALAIPGIGPIVLAGAEATVLATTLAGGAIGAVTGGLIGALVGLGIPEERARVYNDRVTKGQYLVLVNGTDTELAQAETILHRGGIEEYGVYDVPGTAATAATVSHPTTTATTQTARSAPVTVPASGSQRLGQHQRAIGVFTHRRDAEAALTELRDAGFPMDRVSVLAKDSDHNNQIAGVDMHSRTDAKSGNKADDGAKAGAATGAAAGGLGGLLVGLGALAIPGIGPVIAGGAAATAIATALTGGAIGAAAGGLTGALVGLGIPENQAKVYNDRLNRGDYLVMVDGTADEIHRAEAVLKRREIQEWHVFDASEVDANRNTSNQVNYRDTTTVNTGTVHQTGSVQKISEEPEVIVVDRRNETLS
jgi:hypothetical protein